MSDSENEWSSGSEDVILIHDEDDGYFIAMANLDVDEMKQPEMSDASPLLTEAEAAHPPFDTEMLDGPERADTPVPPQPGLTDFLFSKPGGSNDLDEEILSYLRSTPRDDELQGAGQNPTTGAQTYPDGTNSQD